MVEKFGIEFGIQSFGVAVQFIEPLGAPVQRGCVGNVHSQYACKLGRPLCAHLSGLDATQQKFGEGVPVLLIHRGRNGLFEVSAVIAFVYGFFEFLLGHRGGENAVTRGIFAHHYLRFFTGFYIRIDYSFGIFKAIGRLEITRHVILFKRLAYIVQSFKFDLRKRYRTHVEQRKQTSCVLSEMSELHAVDFQNGAALRVPFFVVDKSAYVPERRFFYIAALFCPQRQLRKNIEIFGKRAFYEFFVKQTVYTQAVGRILIFKVSQYRLIKGYSQIAFAVNGVEFFL